MLLGTHKSIITPSLPCDLAGFAHRIDEATEQYGELYLKTTLLQDGDVTVCFFVADIIWWDDDLVHTLRKEISKNENILESNLHFMATHNHSGPQTSQHFSELLGRYHEDFTKLLIKKTYASVKKAKVDLQNVTIQVRSKKIDLGVYRRKLVNGIVEMVPNDSVEIDNKLTVVSFMNEQNKEIATWIHYACHPTSTDANILSSEFPGVCTSELEAMDNDCIVSFLQGFSADVRPKLVKDNEFYRGSLQEMILIGKNLSEQVLLLKKEPCLHEKMINLQVQEMVVSLKYDEEKLTSDLPLSLQKEWEIKKEKHQNEQLLFSYITITENLSLLCANAEMVQAYGQALKKIDQSILPTAYSNGMIGYIASKEQLLNGGYEAETSLYYFSVKGKLHPQMEEIIHEQFNQLIKGEF